MDSSEKKKNCYRNIQLREVLGSFPGAREVSSISGSLRDDWGGITCMPVELNFPLLMLYTNVICFHGSFNFAKKKANSGDKIK